MTRDPYAIPTEKILERLRFENPWWKSNSIDPGVSGMKRRLYFNLIFPLVEDTSIRRALVLMGPRRVGKTVIMHHSIQQLMEQGVPATSIVFVGIDNPLYLNY